MIIHPYQGISYNNSSVSNDKLITAPKHTNNYKNADTFTAAQNKNKQVSFSGIFSRFLRLPEVIGPNDSNPNLSYPQRLSAGMKKTMGIYLPEDNLKKIMGPDELRKILPYLTEQNFISSTENQESGTYGIDLDYQTSFSFDGNEDIFDVLNEAAQYSNYYYAKTGKNFIFAITDKDSVEGIQHAINFIGEHPDKFTHMSFVPGLKMSFAHKAPNSNIGYENSNMLIYGINPFSENISEFIDDTFTRRQKMIAEFIKEVSELYTEFIYKVSEFVDQNGIVFKKDYGKSNMYWRTREYSESKGDTAIRGTQMSPEDILADAEAIFSGMDTVYRGSEETPRSRLSSQAIGNEEVNLLIRKVFDKFSTHFDEKSGQIVSSAENIYADMINCMAREPQKPVMALSAPYYFSHYFEKPGTKSFDNVVAFIEFLQRKSEGMLMGFESVAPSYDLDKELTQEKIDNFNDYIRHYTGLKEVGGSFATRNAEELPADPE